MKNYLLVFLGVLLAVPAATSGQVLPPSFSYTIYQRGEQVGKSVTTVKDSAGLYILESHVSVAFSDYDLELKTRSEADKKTFLVREFWFKGTRMGSPLEGDVAINGKAVTGEITDNGAVAPVEKVSQKLPIIVFENYIISHEVLLARAFLAGGSDPAHVGMYLPSATVVTAADIQLSSELAIESETQEAICNKIVVSIQNSSPFASYFDPRRGLPVYLAFPATLAEVFLDDFFEGQPVSRYRPKE